MKDVYILGISAFFHDSAACLVKNGQIVAAAQEERFTRLKHDPAFPDRAIQYCLKEAGIDAGRLDNVVFYEKPFLKFDRILNTHIACAPMGLPTFLMAMPSWLKQKLFLRDWIKDKLGFSGEVLFTDHHESHAGSGFYPSPFQEAAVLTIDAAGEWTTASYGVGSGNKLKLQAEIRFPHSLGLLYSSFTYYLGFRVNSGEYKVMGLAPYGEPSYAALIRKELVDIKPDGSFKLNMAYFDYCVGLTMTNRRFDRLFGGPARRPESEITQRHMDLARSIQEVTEEIMVKMARQVRKATGQENLCLAGGVALNCVGNGKILREGIFKNVWIQPAAGDAGGSLGAALVAWHQYMEKPRQTQEEDSQRGSFLGPSYEDEIERLVRERSLPCEKVSPETMPSRVAELVRDQNVVGLFQGRMEFGPRALGGRSILGDARSEEMQKTLNIKTKFRESFRPFAPSVLEEKAAGYFELNQPSPYMLLVAQVQAKRLDAAALKTDKKGFEKLKVKRSDMPAITHVDGSARIQTVTRKANPFFHDVLQAFEKLTGYPVMINTSFNVRGEPIVCSPEDAYRCFMATGMDYLVMPPYVFRKTDQPAQNRVSKEELQLQLD